MLKYIIVVTAALGLLSSPAFAEDKTPEQLREERARIVGIEGLESQTFTRVVASGKNQRVRFFNLVNPDCFSVGDVDVRVTKQPEHGTVEIKTTTDFPGYSKESIRSKCNQHKVKGTLVNYKTAEKYTGKDEFDLLILFPDGYAWELHYDMSVR